MEKVTIVVDNVYAKIEHATKDLEMKIYEKLSFTVEEYGAEHVMVRHLFNRKTKKTYTGLLPYVMEIFDEYGVEYVVLDNRIKPDKNADFELVKSFTNKDGKQIDILARPYQQEIIDRATEREVIQAATGAGKTFMMAGVIAKFQVKPVLVFADKLSLVTQIKEEFTKFLGEEIGIIGGGIRDVKDITICSVQSMVEENDLLESSQMIMFDECFVGDTQVTLSDGTTKTISEICDNQIHCKVVSYDTNKKQFEDSHVIGWMRKSVKDKNKKIVKVTAILKNQETRVFSCTEDHKIWVYSKNEYVEARKLTKDMVLLSSKGVAVVFSIEDQEGEEFVYDITVEKNHNFLANDIVVSNCHHVPANTMNEVAKKAKNAYYRIGVSATPWRDGGDDLLIEAILSKRSLENSINASKLIELGFLVPCTIYFIPITQVFSNKNYHTLYKNAIVENKERNNVIVKIATKMLETQQKTTLILIQQVAHGELLQKKLLELIPEQSFTVKVQDPKNGKWQLVRVKNVEFLSGQDDAIRRKAVIEATKEKKVQILIGSTIADEGLDISSLDCLILAGGGKSSTRAFQRVGRVLRLHTNPDGTKKQKAIVFDFQDYTPTLRRHARVREKLYKTEDRWDIKYFNTNLLNDE
jgi:superfamily II DNA or RNA helicase